MLSYDSQQEYSKNCVTEEDLGKDEQGQLLLALISKDLEKFCKLLKNKNVNPNTRYPKPYHATCLQYACRTEGCHEFIQALFNTKKVGPNINVIHPEPIHLAAKYGNSEALSIILNNKKTKLNAIDKYGRTALHYAAKGYVEKAVTEKSKKKIIQCIQLLMERRDFHVNYPNYKGYTAIHEAANFGDEKLVSVMLKFRIHDLDIDYRSYSAKSAREVIEEKFPILKSLLPEGASRDTTSPLQYRLLKSLEDRDINKFKTALCTVTSSGNSRIDPNYWYSSCKSTCLEKAIKEPDCEEFVRELLDAGADPNSVNPITEQAPIHLSVELCNIKALRKLLSIANIDINIETTHCKTPLHIASEKCSIDGVRLLLSKDNIETNKLDANGNTALYIATKKRDERIVQSILDHMESKNKFIMMKDKELISKMFPDLDIQIQVYENLNNLPKEQSYLFQFLYKNKSSKFCEVFENEVKSVKNLVNGNNGRLTFLQYAVSKKMTDVVKLLLSYGADPKEIVDSEIEPPFIIATKLQNDVIMDMFLNLPKDKFNINIKDSKGNTALQFAVSNSNLSHVVKLLRHGANINTRNIYDKSPFDSKTLENILNLCIKKDGYPSEENYRLIFDLTLFLSLKKSAKLQETESNENKQDTREDSNIVYGMESFPDIANGNFTQENTMSECIANPQMFPHKSNQDMERGDHIPSTSSILVSIDAHNENVESSIDVAFTGSITTNVTPNSNNTKCHLYNINSKLESEMVDLTDESDKENISSNVKQTEEHIGEYHQQNQDGGQHENNVNKNTMYKTEKEGSQTSYMLETEMDFLYEISKSEKFSNTINHPVIRCFLYFKWDLIKYFHYANFSVMAVFVLLLNIYLLAKEDMPQMVNTFLLLVATRVFLGLLVLRELIQLIASFKCWFANLKCFYAEMNNFIEHCLVWSLIIGSTLLLIEIEYVYFLMPTTILLSWLELIIAFSHHSFFALRFEMFKRVSKNYLMHLLTYSCIILGFVLGFHSLYKERQHNGMNTLNEFFKSPGLSFVKISMMMNGEFQMDNINFFDDILGTIIFLLFLFFATMVLFNLLTGLAVDDTKTIMDSAKQFKVISEIKQVYEIENIIYKCHWFTSTIFRWLHFLTALKILDNFVKNLMVFPTIPEMNYLLIVYPNKKGEVMINGIYRKNLKMDNEILGDTNDIISARDNISDSEEIKDRLHKIESTINQIKEISKHPDEITDIATTLSEIQEQECDIKEMIQQLLSAMEITKNN